MRFVTLKEPPRSKFWMSVTASTYRRIGASIQIAPKMLTSLPSSTSSSFVTGAPATSSFFWASVSLTPSVK